MNVNVNQYSQSYLFGINSADAPSISNFYCRKAELRYEPEVYVTAQDGEGHTTNVARSDAKVTGTFTGYIAANASLSDLPEVFGFLNRTFIVSSISEPRNKGEFVEVSVEAVSYPNVQD